MVKKVQIYSFEEKHICENCGTGEFKYHGKSSWSCSKKETTYEHICDTCGQSKHLDTKYPREIKEYKSEA